MLLHQLFEATAERTPEKVALVAGGKRYTYRELDELAACLASALRQRGVERGDRVAIFADNGVEVVASVFGALKADAVFMPVNPLTKSDKLAYLLNDSRAACVVTTQVLRDVWEDALAQNSSVRACFVSGLAAADPSGRLLSLEDHIAGSPGSPRAHRDTGVCPANE